MSGPMHHMGAFVPGMSSAGRRGASAVFSVAFWVVFVVLAGHARDLTGLAVADRWADVLLGITLAAGSLVLARAGGDAGGPGRMVRRFAASRAAVAGLAVVVGVLCAAILAPLIASHDPLAIVDPVHTRFLVPSADHPLGTDRLGRDNLARLLYGGRYSLGISITAVMISIAIAVVAGLGAALARGWVDRIVMRLADGLMAFPRQLFVLTLVAFFSPSVGTLIVAIAATSWMRVARLVRAEAARLRGTDFVSAARAAGLSPVRVAWRHILPNVAGPVVVAASLNAGGVILLETYLSFLGLGVAPPKPSWGAMVFEAREALSTAWWVALWPALAITVCVIAFNMMGDGLRDAFDVRLPHPSGTESSSIAAGGERG